MATGKVKHIQIVLEDGSSMTVKGPTVVISMHTDTISHRSADYLAECVLSRSIDIAIESYEGVFIDSVSSFTRSPNKEDVVPNQETRLRRDRFIRRRDGGTGNLV